MKIALFYNRHPGVVGEYFHRALVALGHEVDQFNVGEAQRCTGRYNGYLRIDHGDYAADFPGHLRPAAFYVVDAHLAKSWQKIRRQAGRYDLVFCAQRRAAERLRRAEWVPLGCDPELHGRGPAPKRYDLAFVGNDGGVPRKLYLQELRERYPGSFIGRAPHTEMADIYRQAKLGFHYIECTSPLKDHVSMRVYEVLASGTLLLANALEPGSFEGVGLRPGHDLIVYRDARELLDRIDYYLGHDEERERIAAAGQASALQRHTYRQRVARMVELMQARFGLAAPAGGET